MAKLGVNFFVFFALLVAAPNSLEARQKAEPAFTETAGGMPKYLRIDVAGYNIRTTPRFSVNDLANVDFKANKGSIYPIKKIVQLRSGAAVNIEVDGKDRWVFVPRWRKSDFQFCQSEACFSDMNDVLAMLAAQNISPERLRQCGFVVNPEGDIVQNDLPLLVDDAASDDKSRSAEEVRALVEQIQLKKKKKKKQRQVQREEPEEEEAPAPRPRMKESVPMGSDYDQLQVTPLWEYSGTAESRRWTVMLQNALDVYGKDLLSRKSLSDQEAWCPNFSRLSASEKKEFWVHLFNGIAKNESSFKPQTTFDERTYKNVRRGRISARHHSQGLFQMSYESAGQPAYSRFCRYDWDRDHNKDVSDPDLTIYDPRNQIDCAVGVMNFLVKDDGGLGLSRSRGGARFWSTLRSSNPATARVRAGLKRFTPCWR